MLIITTIVLVALSAFSQSVVLSKNNQDSRLILHIHPKDFIYLKDKEPFYSNMIFQGFSNEKVFSRDLFTFIRADAFDATAFRNEQDNNEKLAVEINLGNVKRNEDGIPVDFSHETIRALVDQLGDVPFSIVFESTSTTEYFLTQKTIFSPAVWVCLFVSLLAVVILGYAFTWLTSL
ncbi:hypothetical protein O9G_003115 [Rozella allomycis CSF55]|uniref:V-type proton ATPase subunit S1/VOA1 transmembrane domain-containing protein n=1 Tax=Rozella allomycis (strain CSF55) TaxID=988480 RepID=A0A075AX82_ROZAC|nr:hypothetical protein O9G_003115 [Rozella allomycis CSF55]|eukprot:EPZ33119.1 hypothetical protein O9G_003115 [Rozella allomycis CSF55]